MLKVNYEATCDFCGKSIETRKGLGGAQYVSSMGMFRHSASFDNHDQYSDYDIKHMCGSCARGLSDLIKEFQGKQKGLK
jgi:hypothetical protein